MEPKTCHHCGNEWTPRKANPKKCPQCQNSLWRSPKPKKAREPMFSNQVIVLSEEEIPEVVNLKSSGNDSLSTARARAEELFKRLQA